MNIICQVRLYSDMALSISVIACVDIIEKFANPFKPRLLTHDFLQKSQIHERIWDVNWEFLLQLIFYSDLLFIHVFSFIFWYCFEHFCHRWWGHDWKKFVNPDKPRLLTHDLLQKRQIRVVSIEYAKLSVFEAWFENFLL